MTALTLQFQKTNFDIVDLYNQPWLRSPQIGGALGYKKGSDSVLKLYESNKDEFTDNMTALVELDTEGGKQKVRIFSLRGCHLLGMFARTSIAKEFRKWVLDILENQSSSTTPEPLTKLAYQGGLELSDQDIIKTAVKQRAESLPKEKWAGATIKMWSTIKAKYGCNYKMIAADQTAAILSLIARMDFDDEVLQIPKGEVELLIKDRLAALPAPEKQDQSPNSISIGLNFPEGMRQITLKFETEGFSHGRWFTALSDGRIIIEKLNDNAMPLTFEQWIEYAIKERGYVVLPKNMVLAKLVA